MNSNLKRLLALKLDRDTHQSRSSRISRRKNQIKQFCIRLGWIKPPKPYGLCFERRSCNRDSSSMLLQDCIGFNVREKS